MKTTELLGLRDRDGNEWKLILDESGVNWVQAMPVNPKPQFKVGDWVYDQSGFGIFRIYKISGLRKDLLYYAEDCYVNQMYCRLATLKEIEEHLIKECKARGLMEVGVHLKSAYHKTDMYFITQSKIEYSHVYDALYCNGNALYQNGAFAEVIPSKKPLPKTKMEFMDFLVVWTKRDEKSIQDFLEDYED